MELATLAVEAEVEATHWWFVGRRRLFARELTHAGLRTEDSVLDVGPGTGANLRMLRELRITAITGLDCNESAIRYCRAKGLGDVHRGDITAMPFDDCSFDFVLATDVVEHVDDDAAALREIARVLKDRGKALVAVPAFPSLWGLQDIVAQHKRRYRMQQLLIKMRKAGLEPRRYYYFNYLLFAPIWLARQLIALFAIKRNSEAEFNSSLINRCLAAVFALDIWTSPLLRPPFGVSILVLAEKARVSQS